MYRLLSIFPQSLVRGAKACVLYSVQKSQLGGFLDLVDRRKGGGCSVLVSRVMILVGVGVVGWVGVMVSRRVILVGVGVVGWDGVDGVVG